jgi:lysyl-tRNA synthetase class II
VLNRRGIDNNKLKRRKREGIEDKQVEEGGRERRNEENQNAKKGRFMMLEFQEFFTDLCGYLLGFENVENNMN